jgi:hypothetical protein
MSITSKKQSERGVALLAVIVVMVILGLLTVVALRTTDDERLAAYGERENTRAFYAAEAGLNAIGEVWDALQYDTLMTTPGDSVDLGWQALPENGASYHGVIHRVDEGSGQPTFTVEVEGRSAGRLGGSHALAVLVTDWPTFNFGVFGRDRILNAGGGTIQSDVATNGDVDIIGASTIVGDATAGGVVSNPGAVTGMVTSGAPPVGVPNVACPTGAYGPAPAGGGVAFDPATGDIVMSAATDKTFNSGTYFYRDFQKVGTGSMIVPPGDRVEIYISGQMDVQGGGFVNSSMDPTALRIYGCGTAVTSWRYTGNADTWLTVYAPNAYLELSGNGDKTGSFVGREVERNGNGSLTHDGSDALDPDANFVPGSWTELSR